MDFAKIKFQYFADRAGVIARVGKKRLRVLARVGAFMMKTVRQRMRKAPKTPKAYQRGLDRKAAKGEAPYYGPRKLLRDRTFFVVDPSTQSVIIGPELLPSSKIQSDKTLPELLDQGGKATLYNIKGEAVLAEYKRRPIVSDDELIELSGEKLAEFTEKYGLT